MIRYDGCKTDCLTASIFLGIVAVIDGRGHEASAAKLVRINISIHFLIVQCSVTCRPKLEIMSRNFTGCVQHINPLHKAFSHIAHVILQTKTSYVLTNGRSPTPTTAQTMGPYFLNADCLLRPALYECA